MLKKDNQNKDKSKNEIKLGFAKKFSNNTVVRGGCSSSTTSSCGISYRQG